VVDADIVGAFDHMSQGHIPEAIASFPARELIKQWLEAGYVDKGVFTRPRPGPAKGL
jgi:RNA-directed DNA polymerase